MIKSKIFLLIFAIILISFLSTAASPPIIKPQGKTIVQTTVINTNITEFIDLTDVPNNYSGAGGKCVSVKGSADGLEFINCSTSGGTFNQTYQNFAHNQTPLASNNITVTSGRILNINGTAILDWLNSVYAGIAWGYNQTTGTINQINVTRCAAGTAAIGLNLSGSFICATITGTMDYTNIVMINKSNNFGNNNLSANEGNFSNLNISGDLYFNGVPIKKDIYNHTLTANTTIFTTYDGRWSLTFNATYAALAYNSTLATITLLNTTSSCGAGNYSYGLNATGGWLCREDVSTAGTTFNATYDAFAYNETPLATNNITVTAGRTININGTAITAWLDNIYSTITYTDLQIDNINRTDVLGQLGNDTYARLNSSRAIITSLLDCKNISGGSDSDYCADNAGTGNASFNESYTNTKYADIKFGYNQSDELIASSNITITSRVLNINSTAITDWLNTLYTAVGWGHNETIGTINLINRTFCTGGTAAIGLNLSGAFICGTPTATIDYTNIAMTNKTNNFGLFNNSMHELNATKGNFTSDVYIAGSPVARWLHNQTTTSLPLSSVTSAISSAQYNFTGLVEHQANLTINGTQSFAYKNQTATIVHSAVNASQCLVTYYNGVARESLCP